jgi:hypothetical protein
MEDDHTVLILYDFRLLVGSYSIKDGTVTVRAGQVGKSTQIIGSSPKILAKLMLRELADDGLV